MRATQIAAYALLLVLAAELAVWESFLSAARPFGTVLPIAAVLAGVGNVAFGRIGARLVTPTWGAVLPGLIWLLVVLPLGVAKSEGDLVVQGGLRGWSLLFAGSVGIVLGAALPRATPSGANGR